MTNNNNGNNNNINNNNNNNNVEMGYRRPGGNPVHEVDWVGWVTAIYFAAVSSTVLGAAAGIFFAGGRFLH